MKDIKIVLQIKRNADLERHATVLATAVDVCNLLSSWSIQRTHTIDKQSHGVEWLQHTNKLWRMVQLFTTFSIIRLHYDCCSNVIRSNFFIIFVDRMNVIEIWVNINKLESNWTQPYIIRLKMDSFSTNLYNTTQIYSFNNLID